MLQERGVSTHARVLVAVAGKMVLSNRLSSASRFRKRLDRLERKGEGVGVGV